LRQNLDWRDFKYLPCVVPIDEEQAAIARFLDYMDRRIRRYIRAKQKLIKLLEEQKQDTTHRVVTRGLDPNVRLTPSGVPWLGEVPEHWEVARLKRVSRIQGGYAFPADSFGDVGIPVVRMNNIRRGTLDFEQVVRVPEHQRKEEFALAEGDIVYGLSGSIGTTGSLGNYALVRQADLPAQLNQRVARFRVNRKRITEGFLLELLVMLRYV
jgi:type I restriction enzyme S subunit